MKKWNLDINFLLAVLGTLIIIVIGKVYWHSLAWWQIVVVFLLSYPWKIFGDIYSFWGGYNPEGDVYSLFGIYQNAGRDAWQLFGISFYQVAGYKATQIAGLSLYQKTSWGGGSSRYRFLSLSEDEPGGRFAGFWRFPFSICK